MTPFSKNARKGGEAPRDWASSSESRITAVHIEAAVIPAVIVPPPHRRLRDAEPTETHRNRATDSDENRRLLWP
jgi:hypothetical protein